VAFDACAGNDCCADLEIGFDDSYLDIPVVYNVAGEIGVIEFFPAFPLEIV